MADQSKVGTDWSRDELYAIVADYFPMLSDIKSFDPTGPSA